MKTKIEVRIYSPKDLTEDWYVYLYSEGKVLKKIYKGINRNAHSFDERMINALAIKNIAELELKKGYNPKSSGLPQVDKIKYTIIDAYKIAYEHLISLDRARTTKNQYRTHHRYFTTAVKELNWSKYMIDEFEPYHILQILEKIRDIFGSGNDAFNKDLKISKVFFNVLQQKFILKNDLTIGIKSKEHRKKEKKLLTDEEQTIVINHFKFVCPAYITFMKTCYHIGIRPLEGREILCSMIDMKNKFFKLPHNITKNRKKGIVIIPDDIYEDLKKLDLSNPNYYLFGSKFPGSRNINHYFTPAENKIPHNKSNNLWREEIKEKLGIDSDMYWLKSKGVNDKLRNGMTMEDIKYLMRHSDISITEIYATEVNKISQEKVVNKFGTFK